jgi:excisionase family DNA binding protein
MKFMTMNEVAETLSVSRMTIHRLVDKGEIKSLKVGRAVRIPEESIKEYVDRNLTKGLPQGNGGEHPEEYQKKRISLRGIAKGGQPITEEDIDEVIREWSKIGESLG